MLIGRIRSLQGYRWNFPDLSMLLPTSSALQLSTNQNLGGIAFLIVASLTAAIANLPSLLEQEKKTSDSHFSFQLDVDFMDKLAKKPYLNSRTRHRPSNSSTTTISETRPRGIPSSFRLLVVDLPEIAKHGIVDGENACRLAADHVYPDGIVSPKKVPLIGVDYDNNRKRTSITPESLLVEQKAWVTSLYECCRTHSSTIKPGIEIMQASTAALNPYDLRLDFHVGKYRYHPGKYYNEIKSSRFEENDSLAEDKTSQQSVLPVTNQSDVWDESEAPWHQYAWLEELQLRISGRVKFGETMEPASFWDRRVWGHHYKRTVRRPWLQYLGSYGGRTSSSDSLDIEIQGNCACHKPHVVIANGAALQRVPLAFRWLHKVCRDQNVPLFIVRDPRRWGTRTNTSVGRTTDVFDEEDLGPVLRQVHQRVKDRVVQTCLRARTGFERGRLVGRMEANAKWEAKELVRKSKHVFQPPPNWRTLDERHLEAKLREHGLIYDENNDTDSDSPTTRCTSSLSAVVSNCTAEKKLHVKPQSQPRTAPVTTVSSNVNDKVDNGGKVIQNVELH